MAQPLFAGVCSGAGILTCGGLKKVASNLRKLAVAQRRNQKDFVFVFIFMFRLSQFLDVERSRIVDIAQEWAFLLEFAEVVVVQVVDGCQHFPALVAGKECFQQVLFIPQAHLQITCLQLREQGFAQFFYPLSDDGDASFVQPRHFVRFDAEVLAMVSRVFLLILFDGLDCHEGGIAATDLKNSGGLFQADQVV